MRFGSVSYIERPSPRGDHEPFPAAAGNVRDMEAVRPARCGASISGRSLPRLVLERRLRCSRYAT